MIELSAEQKQAFETILKACPEYGWFNLNSIARSQNTVQLVNDPYYPPSELSIDESPVAYHVPIIKTFLIQHGFIAPSQTFNIELNEEGRKLKRAGSYEKYLKQRNRAHFYQRSWKVTTSVFVVTTGIATLLSAYFSRQANEISIQSARQKLIIDSLQRANKALHDSLSLQLPANKKMR